MLVLLFAMECTQPLPCVNVRVARKAHARERATGVTGHAHAAGDDALEGFPLAEHAPLGGEQGAELNNCRTKGWILLCKDMPPLKNSILMLKLLY